MARSLFSNKKDSILSRVWEWKFIGVVVHFVFIINISHNTSKEISGNPLFNGVGMVEI